MSRDLGLVELLGADAVGPPGQRRFRLFARSESGSAVMWMEKMQLNELGLAIDRLLTQVTQGKILHVEAQAPQEGAEEEAAPLGMPADFPLIPDEEFQVAQLKLSYDFRRELIILMAVPLEIIMEADQEPQGRVREDRAVTFAFTHAQAEALTKTITRVVSAGRPVCPFCHMPLDGGPHMCEKQNGHRQIIQLLEEEDDEDDEDDEEGD
ncbi:DUF3090 family protein [Thermogemmatispora carboxidivorans]|uniref:DUF3090 family protein n=1 Tax=Thermogemmatispora carboxidivorans TaxID=1382306 RepID=UPI00069AA541|nr:DUF3090 family protein [Thermogemmatispora carboxidivorans]